MRVPDTVIRHPLAVLLALALALRCAWWYSYVHVLENEGVVFARLAQGLFEGDGMIGIFGGRDVLDAPLFPALIGLVALLVGSEEFAGRVVGIVCGTLSVAALYGLAQQMFDARVAVWVGLLVAIHPLMIGLSASVYAESPWILFVLVALYCIVRFMHGGGALWLAGAGLGFGCAYLTRQEALAFAGYGAAALLAMELVRGAGPARALKSSGLFLAACGVVAVPYIVYLSSLAGSFAWEGKSVYNNVQNARIRSGMTVPEAARGLDKEGRPTGVFLNMHTDQAELLRLPRPDGAGLLRTVFDGLGDRAVRILKRTVNAQFISAPWILLPALGGIFLFPWWRTRLLAGLLLLGVTGLQLAILLSVDQLWARYFFAIVPLFILWAGAGIQRLTDLVLSLARSEHMSRSGAPMRVVPAACTVALAAVAFPSVRNVGELAQAEDRTARAIGLAIAADARAGGVRGRPVVMGVGLASVYYGGGTMRYVPYSAEELALAYVRSMQPHYLVLRASEKRQAPYVEAWISRGIPDACAVRMAGDWERAADHARVWRWACPARS